MRSEQLFENSGGKACQIQIIRTGGISLSPAFWPGRTAVASSIKQVIIPVLNRTQDYSGKASEVVFRVPHHQKEHLH